MTNPMPHSTLAGLVERFIRERMAVSEQAAYDYTLAGDSMAEYHKGCIGFALTLIGDLPELEATLSAAPSPSTLAGLVETLRRLPRYWLPVRNAVGSAQAVLWVDVERALEAALSALPESAHTEKPK